MMSHLILVSEYLKSLKELDIFKMPLKVYLLIIHLEEKVCLTPHNLLSVQSLSIRVVLRDKQEIA